MEEKKSYSIIINKKKYQFCSDEGEEHFKKLKSKLINVVDSLSTYESGNILSDYAVKIALFLADEAVRAETNSKKYEEKISQKLPPMLEKLTSVLEDNY